MLLLLTVRSDRLTAWYRLEGAHGHGHRHRQCQVPVVVATSVSWPLNIYLKQVPHLKEQSSKPNKDHSDLERKVLLALLGKIKEGIGVTYGRQTDQLEVDRSIESD